MNDDSFSPKTSFVFRPASRSPGIRKDSASPEAAIPSGRTPRASRMMALAIYLQGLVDSGQVKDYASLAELAHVSRARITQIIDLTLLAPDVQEALLFLPKIEKGRDRINERMLRGIMAEPCWGKQRALWNGLQREKESDI